MLNKEQILNKLNELGLNKDEFIVSMGASLVIHGIKKYTHDININVSKDVLGMYAQLEFSDKYPLTKSERNIINDIRSILDIKEINNNTLYKYGLYINIIAGEILNVDYIKINKLYKN